MRIQRCVLYESVAESVAESKLIELKIISISLVVGNQVVSIIGDGADGDYWKSMLENIQNNNLELPDDIAEIPSPVPDN